MWDSGNEIFTFTFMHLADAFIQSDLHYIQVTVLHFISSDIYLAGTVGLREYTNFLVRCPHRFLQLSLDVHLHSNKGYWWHASEVWLFAPLQYLLATSHHIFRSMKRVVKNLIIFTLFNLALLFKLYFSFREAYDFLLIWSMGINQIIQLIPYLTLSSSEFVRFQYIW